MKRVYCTVWTKEGKQELTKTEWFEFDDINSHRIDGPAIIFPNGTKFWCVNGQYHRVDGPAAIWNDGGKHWYINGYHIPSDEIENWIAENQVDLATNEGQIAIILRWT